MKKRYYFLAFVGLVLGLLAQSNHWFEDERDIYFPITKEQLQHKVRVLKLAQIKPDELSAPMLLDKFRHTKNLQNADLQTQHFELVKLYFYKTAQPSMAHHHNIRQQHLETQNKLKFLLSLQQAWTEPEQIKGFQPDLYANFLLELSRSESEALLVRKQAYKNWLLFTESEHRQKHSHERLAQLVSFSDSKMINTLTSEEH